MGDVTGDPKNRWRTTGKSRRFRRRSSSWTIRNSFLRTGPRDLPPPSALAARHPGRLQTREEIVDDQLVSPARGAEQAIAVQVHHAHARGFHLPRNPARRQGGEEASDDGPQV